MVNNPLVLSLLLLVSSALLAKFKNYSRICLWLGIAVLLTCGNEWVVGLLARPLERRCAPPNPMPAADCILVLAGGTLSKIPPRRTVEVTQEGDRILYAAHLYFQSNAPLIICTGGVSPDSNGTTPDAADMEEFLEMFQVPGSAIVLETEAHNTHEHALNLRHVLAERHLKRVLLVTSAMHMPRSLGVFQHACPDIEFIPAPTDFREVDRVGASWRRRLKALVPTPRGLMDCSDAVHEYVGLAYYKLRGWI